MLSGAAALVRALLAARVKRTWSFGGPPLPPLESVVDPRTAPLTWRATVNEAVAVSMALGGALLGGHATCAVLRHGGAQPALDALGTFGLLGELRSAAVLVIGWDPAPRASQHGAEDLPALIDVAHLAVLEAATPDELYHAVRLAAQASARSGMPVAVRAAPRALEARGEVQEVPPEVPEGTATFARSAGPFFATASHYRFHLDKRLRTLGELEALSDALTTRYGDEGSHGVIVAGHLGAYAVARAWARRMPVLRLGAAWPLPRQRLTEFLRRRDEVLVLEEGHGLLEERLQALAHRAGLTCRIRGVGGGRPQLLDDDRIELVLGRFGGRVRAEVDPPLRGPEDWRRVGESLGALGKSDGEPWPLYLARTRAQLPAYPDGDQRRALLQALRGLDRPTILIAGGGELGSLGLRDRLVDVHVQLGAAAPVAGALTGAVELEERAGSGVPLPVALIGDADHYHSEINGILDNTAARREVLHVLLVPRRNELQAASRGPLFAESALEGLLRACGLMVATAQLDDPGLGAAVAYAASRSGPRALICYAGEKQLGGG